MPRSRAPAGRGGSVTRRACAPVGRDEPGEAA
jgi:hypothetical protein